MNIERRVMAFEIKATSGDGSTGEGIASAFHNVDSYDDIVSPGAFVADMPQFLSSGFIGGMNHDWDNPIGKPTAAEETAEGLKVAWKLSATAHGKDVMTLLKDDVVKKLSIGFRTLDYKWLDTPEEVIAYWEGQSYTPTGTDLARARYGGIRLLTRVQLFEVSPVVLPANDAAVITAVKSLKTEREIEKYLREEGKFSISDAKIAVRGYKLLRDAEAIKTGPQREAEPEVDTETLRLRTQSQRLTSRLKAKGFV